MTNKSDKLPRSSELPSQSPLFWVEQKDRYLRQLLIRDIEQITGRRLLVYFASRYETASQIDIRDSAFVAELFGDLGDDPVDLMLETNGGQTDAAAAVVAFMRNITNDLRVVVPNAAKSNGTLLCLAASKILIGPTSELGPIEPSIQGIPCSILIRKEVAGSNFVLHQSGHFALRNSIALVQRGNRKSPLIAGLRCTISLESSALCEQTGESSVCFRALVH